MSLKTVYLLVSPLRSSEGKFAAFSGPGHILSFKEFQHATILIRDDIYELTRTPTKVHGKKEAYIRILSFQKWNAKLSPRLRMKLQLKEVGRTFVRKRDLAEIADRIWREYLDEYYTWDERNCQTFCYLFARLIQDPGCDHPSYYKKLRYLKRPIYSGTRLVTTAVAATAGAAALALKAWPTFGMKVLGEAVIGAVPFALSLSMDWYKLRREDKRWLRIAQEEMAARASGDSLERIFGRIYEKFWASEPWFTTLSWIQISWVIATFTWKPWHVIALHNIKAPNTSIAAVHALHIWFHRCGPHVNKASTRERAIATTLAAKTRPSKPSRSPW